jgi:ankyrin repeat protein
MSIQKFQERTPMTRLRARTLIGWGLVPLLSVVSLLASDDARLADAVKSQHTETVRALLKQRADVNGTQPDGTTALHWAAHWNDLEIADQLMRAGANVNALTDLGVTPLYLAAEIGSAGMTEKLLAAGANPSLAASTGVSPLMLAARSGAVGAVRALLIRQADVNAREHTNGQTALMWAAAQGHPEVIRLLAERGVDLHARSLVIPRIVNMGGTGDGNAIPAELIETIQTGGNSAMLFAARRGDIEVAKVLLEFGANVNDTAADGNSALVVAAHSGHGEFAAFLLEKGANPNAEGAGYNVLHAAVLRGDLDVVKAGLAHGANPNAPFTKGTPVRRSAADFFLPAPLVGGTPLLLAAKYASVDMIRALTARGADLQLATKAGMTPLMAASNSDRRRQAVLGGFIQGTRRKPGEIYPASESEGVEAVRVLLELGADANAVDGEGNTALHVAVSGQSLPIIKLLADKGARLDVKNKKGLTPLALASAGGRRGAAAGGKPSPVAELLRSLGAKE